MKDGAQRVLAECALIAAMSEESGRTTRRFLTAPVRQVHAHLRERMEALGMTVRLDAVGNLRGLCRPVGAGAKRLLMGSHIDTVPNAGAFDGVLGVVMAIEWVAIAKELDLPLTIEVIAFSEEEGVRFGVPFIGSRAVAGRFDPALLDSKDADDVTVLEAIRSFALEPERIGEAAIDDEVAGFVEVHIEQGPVLEAEKLRVAAVTAIVGQTRMTLNFVGQSNHAGTTPMRLRRDAMAAAAEWICAVESLANATDGLVATVGKMHVDPNAGNVIAGSVAVSLDVRHARDSVRNEAVEKFVERADEIVARRGLVLRWQKQMEQPAAPMDERLTSFMADAIEAVGLPLKLMPSGAGHDAMVMAARVPTTMLFLRSPGGISHHPDETVLEGDVDAALNVGREFLRRMAADVR